MRLPVRMCIVRIGSSGGKVLCSSRDVRVLSAYGRIRIRVEMRRSQTCELMASHLRVM